MAFLIALFLGLIAAQAPAQAPAVLKISVTIVDADGRERPVPRHALLISDNPVSAAPHRVVTTIDGTAEARLKPGNYTVESDEPLIFQGKSYEWVQVLDVPGGRETHLRLTAGNAEVSAAPAIAPGAGTASAILIDWQNSIVSIWSPTRQGSGFVIDARGLIATSERIIGRATEAEVQLSPTMKVAARVLASDTARGVAILWVAPSALASARAMRIGAPAGEKEKVFAIEAPLGERQSLASGIVSKATAQTIVTNINLDERSAGAPLLNAAGEVVAITTTVDDDRSIPDISAEAFRIERAQAVLAEAEKKMTGAPPPATPLPVESERAFDDDALRAAARQRGGRLGAYLVESTDFDVAVITPVLLYASTRRGEQATGRQGGAPGNSEEQLKSMRALQEFANWEDYVRDDPPVVMLRVTPKMVEGFWKTLARGAAESQGVSLPAMKHLKSRFAALRLHCGETEVVPIHPFLIEQRVSEREFVNEALYVFAPDAIRPECGTVKLTLFSEREPQKGDVRPIDAKIVQQIWDDFAPYRAAAK